MTLLEEIHERYVARRRAERLSRHLVAIIPDGPQRLLDIGCGSGYVSSLVRALRPEVDIQGIEIVEQRNPYISVRVFGGGSLPFESNEFDVVSLIDVLHHSNEPAALLDEAVRVARRAIVIKDHLLEGTLAGWRLQWMDRVGNKRLGIPLPFNYWRREQWFDAFRRVRVEPDVWVESLRLYAWPFSLVFDSTLHFVTRLNLENVHCNAVHQALPAIDA